MTADSVAAGFALISVIVLALNLLVLGLVMKLYTEYTKDRAQDRRAHPGRPPEDER